jgi:hypothetical protein
MELSVDPNKMGVCIYEDITSGRLDWNIDKSGIAFPEDAANEGWENRSGESNSAPMFLSRDSKDAMQLVNLCKINDGFLDLPDRTSFVASVAVLNTDGTTGTLNFLLDHKKALDWFLQTFSNMGNIGIRKQITESVVKGSWNGDYAPSARSYETQGKEIVKKLLNELQITGVIPKDLEKILLTPSEK